MQRNDFIDFLRGISILGVLFIHLSIFLKLEDKEFFTLNFLEHLFRFAVPVFFAILGYMTFQKYMHLKSLSDFYFNKIWTIILPFIIWSLIYFPSPNTFPYYPKVEFTFSNLLLGEAEVHLYFLIAYTLFLFITPFIVDVAKFLTKKQISLICMNLITVHLIFLFLLKYTSIDFLKTGYSFMNSKLPYHWISFYAAGVLFFIFKEDLVKLAKRIEKQIPIVFLSSFLLQLTLVTLHVFENKIFIYGSPELFLIFLNSIVLIYSTYHFVKKYSFSKFISFAGKNTFPIFLSHILWFKLSFVYIFKSEISYLHLFFIFLIGTGLSLLYIPIHNFLFNKSYQFIKQQKTK